MACSCIEETNAFLAEHNTRIMETLIFSQPAYTTVTLQTETVTPKRGQRAKTMLPTFCPFCGIRYRPDSSRPEAQP